MNIFKQVMKTGDMIAKYCVKNKATLLGYSAMGGVVVTSVVSFNAGRKYELQTIEHKDEDLTIKEKVKIFAPTFVKPVISGGLTIGCMYKSNVIHTEQKAALATAYSLVENQYKEYKDKVKETIGEKKEEKLKDEIAKDKAHNSYGKYSVIQTDKGSQICLDLVTGKMFTTDINAVKAAENQVHYLLSASGGEDAVSLIDFYIMLGMNETAAGSIWNNFGWHNGMDPLYIRYSSVLMEDGQVYLTIDYDVDLTFEYA